MAPSARCSWYKLLSGPTMYSYSLLSGKTFLPFFQSLAFLWSCQSQAPQAPSPQWDSMWHKVADVITSAWIWWFGRGESVGPRLGQSGRWKFWRQRSGCFHPLSGNECHWWDAERISSEKKQRKEKVPLCGLLKTDTFLAFFFFNWFSVICNWKAPKGKILRYLETQQKWLVTSISMYTLSVSVHTYIHTGLV